MITLYCGENTYESWNAFITHRKQLEKLDKTALKIMDGDTASSIDDIFSDVEMVTFFDIKKTLVIKRLFKNKSKNLLGNVIKHLQNGVGYDVIMWEESTLDKRLKLYKLLKDIAIIKISNNLRSSNLASWVKGEFDTLGMEISNELISKFISRAGTNQFILKNNIDKISIYKRSVDLTVITLKDILSMCAYSPEDSIWELIDSLTNGNKGNSLMILENLVNEVGDYQMFVGLIVRQLRLLLLVKMSRGRPENIAKDLGEHPFVIKKIYNNMKKFDLNRIKLALQKLLNLDEMVKTGRLEPKLGLDLFVITL